MDYCKVYRVEIRQDRVVAAVVVACCEQGKKLLAEYLILVPTQAEKECHAWHIEPTTEEASKEISQGAWEIVRNRIKELSSKMGTTGDITSAELQDLLEGQNAQGDQSDFDGYFKRAYPQKMAELRNRMKCQCLRDLLDA